MEFPRHLSDEFMALARKQDFSHRLSDESRTFNDVDSCCLQCFYLLSRSAMATRYNSSSVSHTPAGRSRSTGDESYDRFLELGFDKLGRLFFGSPTDFADEDNGPRLLIRVKELQSIDKLRPHDGIATDSDAGRLTQAALRELPDSLVRQCATP
jgi:hypothetical protein